MKRARTLPLVIAALVFAATSGRSAAPGAPDPQEFLAVVLHDVVDERAKLDADGTTTSDLVAFFDTSSRMAGTRSRSTTSIAPAAER